MVSPAATEKVFAVVLQLPLLPVAAAVEAVHCMEVVTLLWKTVIVAESVPLPVNTFSEMTPTFNADIVQAKGTIVTFALLKAMLVAPLLLTTACGEKNRAVPV
jgi:hypothetical protein